MLKIVKRVLVMTMACLLVLGTVACGGRGGDRTTIEFRCETAINEKTAYINAIRTYNNGQGKTDGVFVNAAYDVPASNIGQIISSYSAQTPNVVCTNDTYFKGTASLGYFLELDDYLTDDVKTKMDWDNIPKLMINRYSYNTEVDTTIGKKIVGKGSNVLGLPNGGEPSLLFYNKEMLESVGINIISMTEAELDGSNIKPHGYAEYKVSPMDGLTLSKNNSGQDVYKVFNNKIPMNWEEFRYLMKYLQTALQCNYPYMTEWWFNYGWSVGGDCVGWDEAQGEYVFTLNDKKANFLVVSDTTINGVDYKAGDVLNYEDKEYLHNNPTLIDDNVYELPSMYDAFLEFNRISVPKDKTLDIVDRKAIYGYGFTDATQAQRESQFKAGVSPFLVASYNQVSEFQASNVKNKFDVALQQQYREYEQGSLVDENDFENIQVKVIGETYGGEVYNGELKKVNGTVIVGRPATQSLNYCISIAKHSDPSEYDAAFKFASWLAGPEAQKILSEGNGIIPNQTNVAYNEEFANSSNRLIDNMWAAVYANENADIGDWAYFDEGSWVTDWSLLLNSSVRQGDKTLADFFEEKVDIANNALKNMNLRIYRR